MDGTQVAQIVRQKADEFKKACVGISEETASRAPEGRWSPKEIVSHVSGPEGIGLLPALRAFLKDDTPTLELHPGDPFFSEKRAKTTFTDLLKAFEKEYQAMADFVAGLSEEQLNRKAHMPELKESPLGEYPTLGNFVQGITGHHLDFHKDHMREIVSLLNA